MSGERHDGPGTVGLDVPDLDGLVVGAAHDPTPVELDAADGLGVTLEGPDVTLTLGPATTKLVPGKKRIRHNQTPPSLSEKSVNNFQDSFPLF